jgi:hypothetical protein
LFEKAELSGTIHRTRKESVKVQIQNFFTNSARRTLWGCALALVTSRCVGSLPPGASSQATPFRVAAARTLLKLGVTHTQYSLDPWGDKTAVAHGTAVLIATTNVQNQSIMGWGALNPEPAPGHFAWRSLDRRVALMRKTNATMVITLCCAPDWMKGGKPGHTNWNRLDVAPYPSHYKDFAALAAAVARRYPDVRSFQVWNELKGFWDAKLNRWNYERYTQLYNDVYAALKAVSPSIQVGGPYVFLDLWIHNPSESSPISGPYGTVDRRDLEVIKYWLVHKRGADFITFDSATKARDGDPRDWFSATQLYGDVDRWITVHTSLPIYWAEWYSSDDGAKGVPFDWNRQNALMAATLIEMARTKTAVELRWQPQGLSCCPYDGNQESIWSDTRVTGGGQPFPFADTAIRFRRYFPPETLLVQTACADRNVEALSSARTLVVVNGDSYARTVTVNGRHIRLGADEVRFSRLFGDDAAFSRRSLLVEVGGLEPGPLTRE